MGPGFVRGCGFRCADAGECDVAENCTDTAAACPTNVFEPAATPCGSGAEMFDQDTSLIVQLLNDEGACWSMEFTPAQTKSNTATSFKAVGP